MKFPIRQHANRFLYYNQFWPCHQDRIDNQNKRRRLSTPAFRHAKTAVFAFSTFSILPFPSILSAESFAPKTPQNQRSKHPGPSILTSALSPHIGKTWYNKEKIYETRLIFTVKHHTRKRFTENGGDGRERKLFQIPHTAGMTPAIWRKGMTLMVTREEVEEFLTETGLSAACKFIYHDTPCQIEPTEEGFILSYGDKNCTLEDWDPLFETPFFDDKTLEEILPEVEEIGYR